MAEPGTSKHQAQVRAAALWNVLCSDVSAIRAEMATKSDLAAARIELQASIDAVRTDLTHTIDSVRTELKQDIAAMKAGLIRRMIGGMIGLSGAIACIMALMLAAKA